VDWDAEQKDYWMLDNAHGAFSFEGFFEMRVTIAVLDRPLDPGNA
jgi:hypothetical protein